MPTQKPKRSRLNMRVPKPLLEWTKRYARQKNTSVTQLFIDHITELKVKEEVPNAAQ